MSNFWLTPVTTVPFVVVGGGRTKVAPGADWEAFRRRLHTVHPRLLPLFKAHLLAADDAGDGSEAAGASCGGTAGLALDLSVPGPLAFDGGSYTLSHCAEAFLERLLEPAAAVRRCEEAGLLDGLGQVVSMPEAERVWLDAMLGWWRQGAYAVLFG